MPDEKVRELTIEEKIAAVNLKKAEMELKIAERNLKQFEESEANSERITKIRVEAAQRQAEEEAHKQSVCKHKTGGKGKDGFLNGDGVHGYTVGHQTLPTGEYYMICTRCQKEWHHPDWSIKIEVFNLLQQGRPAKTSMTLEQYDKQKKEYEDVLNWGHEYTSIAEASQFRVPMLERINPKAILNASNKAS